MKITSENEPLYWIEMHRQVPDDSQTRFPYFIGGGRTSDGIYLMFVCTKALFGHEIPEEGVRIDMWITPRLALGVAPNSAHTLIGFRRYWETIEDNGAVDRTHVRNRGYGEYLMDFGERGIPIPFRQVDFVCYQNTGAAKFCSLRLYGKFMEVSVHEYLWYQQHLF